MFVFLENVCGKDMLPQYGTCIASAINLECLIFSSLNFIFLRFLLVAKLQALKSYDRQYTEIVLSDTRNTIKCKVKQAKNMYASINP